MPASERGADMRRREFIGLVGGAAAWPVVVRAQQKAGLPVVGFLHALAQAAVANRVAAFLEGLKAAGYLEGRNFTVEYRWAEGRYDRLPALAHELVTQQVTAILAGTSVAALAAKDATSTIPIIFTGVSGDPVELGLVQALNRPDGNVTGFSVLTASLGVKRLEMLSEIAPTVQTIGVFLNRDNPNSQLTTRVMPAAATSLGRKLVVVSVGRERNLSGAFDELAKQGVGALIVDADPLFLTQRDQIIALAARNRLPTIYEFQDYTAVGGLMSYSPDYDDAYRQGGLYVARVLKGERPSDLPVAQPTKFVLSINLKTAKALGLTVPPTLLARADHVIE
jgi:putative tryptophan/tyrosine transport system substrate-binding protein